ncbi:PRC-barrel domain-containing protein [Rhodopseudomonas pseudopalustris]|uniref:PRC-barrel domain-containing protein n=1 Tax=Rhodopseudomonas pseudopalustris TaxID=1513892 RepID=UPI003F94418A
MNAKMIIAGLLGTTMLSTMAVAQTPAPSASPSSSMSKSSMSQPISHKGQWRSSKVIGVNVYNANNENLGEINELLVDQSGKVQAVVIGVGGFLGMGERYVAIPFEKLQWSNEPVRSASASRSSGSGMAPSGSSSTTTGSATTGSASSSTSSATNASGDQWYPDHAILNVSKDELKSMPEFKYST